MTENIQKGLSLFQLTAARRRLGRFSRGKDLSPQEFQLTAARRRLVNRGLLWAVFAVVSTHSRPKAAGNLPECNPADNVVSTHSRPKAAGGWRFIIGLSTIGFQLTAARRRLALFHMLVILLLCFNSQPPEGGWERNIVYCFNI